MTYAKAEARMLQMLEDKRSRYHWILPWLKKTQPTAEITPSEKLRQLADKCITLLRDKQKANEDENQRRLSNATNQPPGHLNVDYIDAVFTDDEGTEFAELNVIAAMHCLIEDVHRFADFDLYNAIDVSLRDN
jgi:hypothetical protein